MSPTQRTMSELKKMGRHAAIVERWDSYAKCRRDMWGFIDIIVLDKSRGVGAIQSCGNSFSAHWHKITEEKAQEVTDWLETPGTFLELWSWRKLVKKRGGKAMIWQPRIQEITLKDIK